MANFIFFFTLAITGITGILRSLSKTISANYLSQSRCSKMPTMLPPSKTSFILYHEVPKAALTPEALPASSYGYFFGIFLSQFSHMVLDKGPVSFFCMWIFSFPSPICCKTCPFLWALDPYQESFAWMCEGLFRGFLFHSIGLYTCLSICQCHTVLITSFVVFSVSPSALFLFVRIVLSI